jgi:hypothetical protein
MKGKIFGAVCLVAANAHADDVTLHVTGASGVLVQKTPSGWVGLCNTPCDVRADASGEYRFAGLRGSDVPDSRSFILPPGNRVELNVRAGSRSGRRIGVLVGVIGGVVIATGIAFIIGGYVINSDNPGLKEGDPYQIGGLFGVIAGIVTTSIGAVHAYNNSVSWITAAPSNVPAIPAPHALSTQIVSLHF